MQSFVNKADELLQVLADENVDIAPIQESWFSSENNVTTAKIKNAGYDIKHVFREKRGAGVAVLYKKGFSSLTARCGIPCSNYSSFQHQCLIFNFNPKIHLISIYRHQEISMDIFLVELEQFLEAHSKYTQSILLVGDFNVWYEKADSPDVIKLNYVLSTFGLAQHVIGPTHKYKHTLDLIYTNPFELNVTVEPVVDYGLSDHFPIIFKLNNIHSSKNNVCSKQVTYRNIKNINLDEFKLDLSSQLNDSFKYNLDFNSQYKLFSDITTNVLDKFAPQKTKTVASKISIPWQDSEYRTERALRRKFEREWKKSGKKEGIARTLYVNQRKKCANLSSTKRSQYYTRLIRESKDNQGSLFKIVSQVLDKNQHSGTIPQYEKNLNTLAKDFNHFYVDKVSKIRNAITPIKEADITQPKLFTGTLLEEFSPTTVEELRTIISSGEIKTAFNDILPRDLMKSSIEVLLPYICTLINTSLATGSMEGIKESTIMPILKKNGLDPEVLKNYRPVSDIVVISKLIEKVVLRRLYSHERSNGLQCHHQHGYKKFHSTETLLLSVVNDVLIGFDKNSGTILILLDLSAAFDTVDIDKLLSMLDHELGIRGTALKWFKSFLVGRKQRVRLNNILSDFLDVLFGVPQGSVLGPVLFNLYTRGLFTLIKNAGFGTSGYADDSNARQTFSLSFQFNTIVTQVPALLDIITKWMNEHFLKINPDKTEIILFTPNCKVNTINGVILSNGDCVRFSSSARNLGFHFDSHMTLEPHINNLVSHCYKLLKDVRIVRNLLTKEETEQLVHAIISSRLDYCNSLFFGLNKSEINKLQKVQNAAARLVLERRKCDSIRTGLINLHWLRIEERIVFKILVTVYKCLHDMAPNELSELITISDVHSLKLQLVFMNTTHGRRSFSYIAPRLWNELPYLIRNVQALLCFKSKLKTYLFTNFQNYMQSVYRYIV